MLRWIWVGCALLGACSNRPSDAEIKANQDREKAEAAALLGAYGKELAARAQAAHACEKTVLDAVAKALPQGFDSKLKQAPKNAAALDGALLFEVDLEHGIAERIAGDDYRGTRLAKLPHVETANAACVGPTKQDEERLAQLKRIGYLDYSSEQDVKKKLDQLQHLPEAKPPAVAVAYWSSCKTHKGALYVAKDYSASASSEGYSCQAALAWVRVADGTLLAVVAGSGAGVPDAASTATRDQISNANGNASADAMAHATAGFGPAIEKWPP